MAKALVIKTERTLITPFSERHLTEQYVGWLKDPEVVRFSEQRHRTHTLETCKRYFKSFENTSNYFWALEEVKEGFGHIGNITTYVNISNQLADVGILVGEKKAWGKGYGFETFYAVCHYLLDKCGIRKVTAGTLSVNIPMVKIMKRMNMVEDGRRIRHYICDGEPVDLIHMALYRDDFK